MKNRIFIFLSLILVLLSLGISLRTDGQEKEEAQKFETIEISTGGAPHWSPDGTKLAFMSGGWLCVKSADGKGEIKKVAEIRPDFLEWVSDSEFVVYEREYPKAESIAVMPGLSIKKITMDGRVTIVVRDTTFSKTTPPKITPPKVLPDGTVGYYECQVGYLDRECKDFKIIKQGKLKPDSALKQLVATTEGFPAWGEIYLESVDRTAKKKITAGKEYLFPKLSPDGSKILANYGPAYFVLDLKGEILLDLGKYRPQLPDYPSPDNSIFIVDAYWSPDSKRIFYYVTVEDGHFTYEMDIYVINIDGTGNMQIAATRGEKEGGASWSPDGKKISYVNQTTGRIYIVKILGGEK